MQNLQISAYREYAEKAVESFGCMHLPLCEALTCPIYQNIDLPVEIDNLETFSYLTLRLFPDFILPFYLCNKI